MRKSNELMCILHQIFINKFKEYDTTMTLFKGGQNSVTWFWECRQRSSQKVKGNSEKAGESHSSDGWSCWQYNQCPDSPQSSALWKSGEAYEFPLEFTKRHVFGDLKNCSLVWLGQIDLVESQPSSPWESSMVKHGDGSIDVERYRTLGLLVTSQSLIRRWLTLIPKILADVRSYMPSFRQ